ncbi:uncharacterized protein LAESUDRAFT_664358 [Laetiporus sulphureus 93-53]|uniref:TPR-like protein n=1 Tax=Laetiporus sulphureus 93-53 TaxID=1314785 RepID=A0A165BKX7_9APHY|nr:uncharacterized protein LAESUDRAFT_664358 [Laetiporus sulphureus 93-53]KZT01242.1 hypothetical protein LAESUDRAFT_664358 [Laetiporus sulphureus 93-53]
MSCYLWSASRRETRRLFKPQHVRVTVPRALQRGYATSPRTWLQSNSRVSTVFGALIALGVASTAFGIYKFYQMFTMWPKELRADLRAGIKAKYQGNYKLSEQYLRKAYDKALSLPLSVFSPAPHLKLSGLAIALASVIEDDDRPQPAYEVYVDALARIQSAKESLTGRERMRAVALASKLGEMAETYQLPVAEEERWLTWAVEELLHIVRDEGGNGTLAVEGMEGKGEHEGQEKEPVMLAELDLPPWVTKTDLGAPLEALGRFYSRGGNVEYAVPLYLQAISILVPPTSSKRSSTIEERCRGAQLMNNLAELAIRDEPTATKRKQAEAWARQGLATIEKTKASARGDEEGLMLCEEALAAVLFNLGSLLEMDGDVKQSKELYKQSLEQARNIKMREGVIEAQAALRRLDRVSKRSADTAMGTQPVTSQ